MANLNWREPMRDGEPPLWAVAEAIYKRGIIWDKVAEVINMEYDLPGDGVAVDGPRCRVSALKARQAGKTPGSMPMPDFVLEVASEDQGDDGTATATAGRSGDRPLHGDGKGDGNGGGGGVRSDREAVGATPKPAEWEEPADDHLESGGEAGHDEEDPFDDGGEDEGPRFGAALAAFTVSLNVPGAVIEVSTTDRKLFRHVGPLLADALAGV